MSDLIPDEKIVIIVTASGDVKSACNYNLSTKDSAFLNIGSTLAIEEIKKKIRSRIMLTTKIKDAIHYRFSAYDGVDFFETGETKNIISTIEKTLESVNNEWCLINPITTIPLFSKFDKEFIEFGSEMIPKENWSSCIQGKEGLPFFIKKSDKEFYGIKSHPFTGRIFAKTEDIRFVINNLIDSEKNDLINLAVKLFEYSNVKIRYTKWLDIGHPNTYQMTRISAITSRFFNTLTYDKNKNTIKKKSIRKIKINNEIAFYKTLPSEYKIFFPMFQTNTKEGKETSYEMEYIDKPNLSEIFLFSRIGPNSILRIFNSIENAFKTFYNKKSLLHENASHLYSLKTKEREFELRNIMKNKEFDFLRKIYEKDFKLNNHIFPSLKKSFSVLNYWLKKFEVNRPFHIGHGDLCFNNILVDPIDGKIHLIDPKAEVHIHLKKYGLVDNFYDLSKLNHSINGFYDSVVNNLFKLDTNDSNNLILELYKPNEFKFYNNYFKDIMIFKRINEETLGMLTANLFLSMLPLHRDNNKRLISLSLLGSIFISEHKIEDIV